MENIMLTVNWSETFTLVAICFSIVVLILLLFIGVLKIFELVQRTGKNKVQEVKTVVSPVIDENAENTESDISESEYAAIATAIHLFFEVKHDDESLVLTIRKNSSNYSPWNIVK